MWKKLLRDAVSTPKSLRPGSNDAAAAPEASSSSKGTPSPAPTGGRKISLKSSPLMRLAAARVSTGQAARQMQELAAASIQESGPEHVSQRALRALRILCWILCLLGKEIMVNQVPCFFYA